MAETVELLTAHHLPYRVVNIIEEAREFVLLVTAYLDSWTHLDHAIKNAVSRGVPITLVMRSPDGAKRDRAKREDEARSLKELGVQVHFVDRLHAKAYVNEKEAIVTSFNLVSGSNESIELGVLIQDPKLVRDCVAKVRAYCPELPSDPSRAAKLPNTHRPTGDPESAAFCIGCSDALPFNPAKPMCLSCYRSSGKGEDFATLPRRACHCCGKPGLCTLSRPLCPECWKALPKDRQIQITSAIS